MKLSTKEDIEAPMAFVYQTLTDFDVWERAAMRRGADVSRTDTLRVAGPGMAWLVQFPYRGKDRKVAIRLTDQVVEQRLGFAGSSSMVDGWVSLDLLEMGAKRTRVTVVTEIKPRTLTARLFLQTLRLARAKMTKRYQTRIAQFGADIEDRYRSKLRFR